VTHPGPDRRHVLVIGAGPGLGAAVARRFGREGYRATLVARTEETVASVADELRRAGVEVGTATADAADPAGFRAALQAVAATSTPGVVVYNVGLVVADDVLTEPAEHFAGALAVDVVGALTAAQVFTPAMRAAGAGTLLVTGGGPGLEPDAEHASLSLGKAALHSAVALLHERLAPDGVHAAAVVVVGVIAPGTALDPDRIAETYWELHAEPAGSWRAQVVVDGS